MTTPRYEKLSVEDTVHRLNRTMSGWANYFHLGQVGPAYQSVDRTRHHAAATVALPKAQGEVREVRALPGHEAMGKIWPHHPCADGQAPSVGEGMISSES